MEPLLFNEFKNWFNCPDGDNLEELALNNYMFVEEVQAEWSAFIHQLAAVRTH